MYSRSDDHGGAIGQIVGQPALRTDRPSRAPGRFRTPKASCVTTPLAALAHLPDDFRANAEEIRRLAGDERTAQVWEAACREVESRLRAASLEPLDLSVAAQESGYTRGHLGKMLRDGTLPNAGTASEPLVLRVHLPRKPGFGVDQNPMRPASSRVQAARAVIEGDN